MVPSRVPSPPDCNPWLNDETMTFSNRTCGILEGALGGGGAISRDLGNSPPPDVPSRMEMRLLRETRSVFEYLHKTLRIVSDVDTHRQ